MLASIRDAARRMGTSYAISRISTSNGEVVGMEWR